jgi:hypothetical protein
MSIAWYTKAYLYDKLVTESKNKMLKDFIRKEEEMLDSSLENIDGTFSLIEVGSGTGRTLFSFIWKQSIFERLNYLIGIDNSAAMYQISVEKLNKLKNFSSIPETLRREIDKKFIFFNIDALEMNYFFRDGKANQDEFEKRFGENDFLRKFKIPLYNDSRKVVCCLLNTLGVILDPKMKLDPADARQRVVNNMVSAAGQEGTILISVFSARSFHSKALKLYKSLEKITGKFDEKAFNKEEYVFKTRTYYSHWFEKEEIVNLLKKAGCKNIYCKVINGELEGYFIIGKS